MTAFSLGAVLSVTTGRLLANFGDVHELLDYLTGEALMTHQLPRALGAAAPKVLLQHPDLAGVVVPEDLEGEEAVRAWITRAEKTHGATRDLAPLDGDDWTRIHPLAEIAMVAPHLKVVAVNTDTGEVSDVD